jgi:hypothetical protein
MESGLKGNVRIFTLAFLYCKAQTISVLVKAIMLLLMTHPTSQVQTMM